MPDLSGLAIDGGTPVRTEPLPLEFPGVHFMDEEEIEAVTAGNAFALTVPLLRTLPLRRGQAVRKRDGGQLWSPARNRDRAAAPARSMPRWERSAWVRARK